MYSLSFIPTTAAGPGPNSATLDLRLSYDSSLGFGTDLTVALYKDNACTELADESRGPVDIPDSQSFELDQYTNLRGSQKYYVGVFEAGNLVEPFLVNINPILGVMTAVNGNSIAVTVTVGSLTNYSLTCYLTDSDGTKGTFSLNDSLTGTFNNLVYGHSYTVYINGSETTPSSDPYYVSEEITTETSEVTGAEITTTNLKQIQWSATKVAGVDQWSIYVCQGNTYSENILPTGNNLEATLDTVIVHDVTYDIYINQSGLTNVTDISTSPVKSLTVDISEIVSYEGLDPSGDYLGGTIVLHIQDCTGYSWNIFNSDKSDHLYTDNIAITSNVLNIEDEDVGPYEGETCYLCIFDPTSADPDDPWYSISFYVNPHS